MTGNPFDPAHPAPAYAGRTALFAHIHQHLTSAPVPHAVRIVGRRHSGRTATLTALRSRLGETVVWATLALTPAVLRDEVSFWGALYQACKDGAAAHGLSVYRLPVFPDDAPPAKAHTWLGEKGLPELYQLIRPHRRIVLAVDDALALAEAVERAQLPHSLGAALAALFGAQFNAIFTIHIDAEPRLLNALPGLFDPDESLRLDALTPQEVREFLTHGREDVSDEVAAQVHRLTGGQPELVRRAAALIHDASHGEIYTLEHVKSITLELHTRSAAYFEATWDYFSADEQAALAAIAHIRYAHPEKVLNADDLEVWLADTDYPLDLTTLQSVLRRMLFVEIIHSSHGDLRLRSELFEAWIRNRARPDQLRRTPPSALDAPVTDPRLIRYGLVILVLILLLLGAAALFGGTPAQPPTDMLPTVTLGG